jgi:DNA-binding transcriptional ArsR family regulator
MVDSALTIDAVFKALADPTRRGVLQRLSAGTASASELAQPFEMALPSFMQHLNVLETAGLVRSRKVGRVRMYELDPKPLKAAEDWLAEQRALWERRLDQLDDYLRDLHKQRKKQP